MRVILVDLQFPTQAMSTVMAWMICIIRKLTDNNKTPCATGNSR
jgi:hypothetical protein